MENEQNNKELESLTKRIRFKSLPFDEKQMSDRLTKLRNKSLFFRKRLPSPMQKQK